MGEIQQPIEAANGLEGMLDKIKDIFFKGLDGLLNSAAEYKDDFGVLKQVSTVPLISESGREYSLVIELSPVKYKNDTFFVTAKTNAPNFDVSSINEKVFKINKNTTEKFNKLINDLIDENNLKINEEAQAKDNDESEGEEDESVDINEKITELIEEAEDEFNGAESFVQSEDDEPYLLDLLMDHEKDSDKVTVKMFLIDEEEKVRDDVCPIEETDIDIIDENDNLINYDDLESILKKLAQKYAKNHNLKNNGKGLFGSTNFNMIKATFIKSSETNEVSLIAINSQTDLGKAFRAISAVTNDDEFIACLTDTPQSYEITEYCDGYDVNPIDSVETSCYIRKGYK